MERATRLWRASTQYQILDSLGEGAYSHVYRAERFNRSLGLRQTVAMKVLKSKNAVEMWRNEFESLARVKSPYCVQVFAFEESESGPALVLEFVDGLNLRDLVQYAFLTQEDCQEIIAQIQCGLVDLQTFGLCHGDLSPKNIMVDSHGQIRLLDFGLANLKSEYTLFTPGFAAPEILAGGKPDFSTDQFSLTAIAQFLAKYSEAGQSIVTTEPPKRRRQQALARAVCAALEKKQSLLRDFKTKTVQAIQNFRSPILKLKLMMGILIFAFSSSSQTNLIRATGHNMLKIRTESWHYIKLDGRAIGYAPVDIQNLSNGSHEISWENARGKGTLQVHLNDSASKIISEKELHSY